jgi:hypothetical protein
MTRRPRRGAVAVRPQGGEHSVADRLRERDVDAVETRVLDERAVRLFLGLVRIGDPLAGADVDLRVGRLERFDERLVALVGDERVGVPEEVATSPSLPTAAASASAARLPMSKRSSVTTAT